MKAVIIFQDGTWDTYSSPSLQIFKKWLSNDINRMVGNEIAQINILPGE